MQKPDGWPYKSLTKAVVSVSFDRADWECIADAARLKGVSIPRFIREGILGRPDPRSARQNEKQGRHENLMAAIAADPERSLADIGRAFGISKERVRQIVASVNRKALREGREPVLTNGQRKSIRRDGEE